MNDPLTHDDGLPKRTASAREEVFRELAQFLRHRSQPEVKSRLKFWIEAVFAFLDRPFVLALIAGGLIAILNARFQVSQKDHEIEVQSQHALVEQKIALFRTFAILNQKYGNLLNHVSDYAITCGRENIKIKNGGDPDVYNRSLAELNRENKELSVVEPIGSMLVQIKTFFNDDKVRSIAGQMRGKYDAFNEICGTAVKASWPETTVNEDELTRLTQSKNDLKKAINKLEDQLFDAMGVELSRNMDAVHTPHH